MTLGARRDEHPGVGWRDWLGRAWYSDRVRSQKINLRCDRSQKGRGDKRSNLNLKVWLALGIMFGSGPTYFLERLDKKRRRIRAVLTSARGITRASYWISCPATRLPERLFQDNRDNPFPDNLVCVRNRATDPAGNSLTELAERT